MHRAFHIRADFDNPAWWLRTPNPSNGYNVRYVNSSGALNNNNANNSNGSAADYIIWSERVEKSKAVPFMQGKLVLFGRKLDEIGC